MSLLNHLKSELQKGNLIGFFPTGITMQRFQKAEASSLSDEERNLPNYSFVIKDYDQKTKFFAKQNDQWYSYTASKEVLV